MMDRKKKKPDLDSDEFVGNKGAQQSLFIVVDKGTLVMGVFKNPPGARTPAVGSLSVLQFYGKYLKLVRLLNYC